MIPAEYRSRLAPYMRAAPVNVAECARSLGLEVFSMPLGAGVSGVLLKDSQYGTKSGFAIFVDSTEARVRQRFTAAHEIGHYVLHRDMIGDRLEENYLLRAHGLSNKQEAQANAFAADLLMPFDLIDAAIKSGIKELEALARHFSVSRVAMSIRLGLPT